MFDGVARSVIDRQSCVKTSANFRRTGQRKLAHALISLARRRGGLRTVSVCEIQSITGRSHDQSFLASVFIEPRFWVE